MRTSSVKANSYDPKLGGGISMRHAMWLAALGIHLCMPALISAQGILRGVREDIQREEKNNKQHHDCDCDEDDEWAIDIGFDCDEDDEWAFDIGWLFGSSRNPTGRTVEYREIQLPDGSIERRKIVYKNGVGYENEDEYDWELAFPAYPYPFGLPGYMQFDPTPIGHITGVKNEDLYLKWYAVRLAIEEGWDFNTLNRLNGQLQAETQFGVGIHTSWNWFHENLACGCSDDAVIGNITATWRFLETRHLLFRWGIGAWVFTDEGLTDTGVNLHLSADIFPAPPWVISTILEFGSIGETDLLHARGTVGYLFHGVEIYGGYDFMQIGNNNLQGPLVGLRVWF